MSEWPIWEEWDERQRLFLYLTSLTLDDLVWLKQIGIGLDEREEERLLGFLNTEEEYLYEQVTRCSL
jgi:hypothetical protein